MKDYFFLAFNNLRRRKLRAWLTMIGIFIGIAAVVGLISLGQGLQAAINQQFEQLGSDKIIISTKTMGFSGSTLSRDLLLTTKDINFIENINGVKWAIGIVTTQGLIKFKDETKTIIISGISPEDLKLLGEVQSYTIEDGRDLKEGDKYRVVVGYNHKYKDLWKKPAQIGDSIEINNREFKIIGIMGKIGNKYDDEQIYVPKETFREVYKVGDEEGQILVKTASGYNPNNVAKEIERKLRKFREEKEGQETFNAQTSEQLLETFTKIFGVAQAVLVGIAAISLIVGGIGIMNTMYTAVLERTKEIGTMKAVGAKNLDILSIFLIESGLLGLAGGIIGIIIGIGLGKSAEYIAGIALGTNLLKATFSPYLIFGALMFSFLIGTISGILPAMQAAKLRPTEALRYE